jgi:hypothetical protein
MLSDRSRFVLHICKESTRKKHCTSSWHWMLDDAIGKCIAGVFQLSHQLVFDLVDLSKTIGLVPYLPPLNLFLRHLALMETAHWSGVSSLECWLRTLVNEFFD